MAIPEDFNRLLHFSLKIDFVLPNSADPDEVPHFAAFHLDLHCLQMYQFMGCTVEGSYGIANYIRTLFRWHLQKWSNLSLRCLHIDLSVGLGFVYADALCPSQQFFSHIGTNSCLPGLKKY